MLLISKFFEKYKNNPFLIDGDSCIYTYENANEIVNTLRSSIDALGLPENTRVLILLPRGPEYIFSILACLEANVITCPIDITIPVDRLNSYKDSLDHIYMLDSSEYAKLISRGVRNSNVATGNELGVFMQLFSSGTTSAQKSIAISSSGMINSALSFSALTGVNEESRFIHNLPMFYMAGIFNLIFVPLVSGASIVVERNLGAAALLNFWGSQKKYGVNRLILTPTMALGVTRLERNHFEIQSMLEGYQMIMSTGSFLYPSIRRKFTETYEVSLQSCYGVTEVGGSITIEDSTGSSIENSVGKFAPTTDIKIQNDLGISKVLVRTPNMMLGYLHGDDLILPFDSEGFFDTGDIGYIESGELVVTGRIKDVIKKGGELINLSYIENLALSCPLISEAVAVGEVDEYWGETIKLYVVPASKYLDESGKKEVNFFLAERLRKIEIPDSIEYISDIPKTSIGKPIKRFIGT
jgi:acyl-CoA synthetase (AMP-forming)/AMP-acid ligase II